MHYETMRKADAQNALTQTQRLPKIRAAYLDRLRERPLEAGATIPVHVELGETVPTPADPSLQLGSGR
jgi:hypothetical protein